MSRVHSRTMVVGTGSPQGGPDESITDVPCPCAQDDDTIPCCSVCLGPMAENNGPYIQLQCTHRFHVQCIELWLQKHSSCPCCRAPADEAAGTRKTAPRERISASGFTSDKDLQIRASGFTAGAERQIRASGFTAGADPGISASSFTSNVDRQIRASGFTFAAAAQSKNEMGVSAPGFTAVRQQD